MDTMTEPSLRNALSCDRCGEWFFTETITRGPIACPICAGKVTRRGFIKPDRHAFHVEERSVCDARCTDANGVDCNCSCNGRNHGSRRVVNVEVIDGIVTLALDSAKCATLAAKRLPEIERSETLRDELVARLEVVFATELAVSRAGGRQDWPGYHRMLQWRQSRSDIRHAMGLKVPRNRVKALEKIAAEIEGWAQVTQPLMKCGHTAQGTTVIDGNHVPCCVICPGIDDGAMVVDDAPPSLEGRTSRCDYYRSGRKCSCGKDHCPPNNHNAHGGNYPSVAPSSTSLPFFQHQPDKAFDSHFCGCWGWN